MATPVIWESFAMGFRGKVLFAALILSAAASVAASAQQLQFDAKSLDASGAAATPHKGKKAASKSQAAGGSEKPGKVDNRQFGELEGWSPGKTPPKKKDKDDDAGSRFSGSAPVSVSPSGNMSVGVPF
jgi:hypothetical protein